MLQVAVPEPRAVEAELLAPLDDPEGGLVALGGIRRVNVPMVRKPRRASGVPDAGMDRW